MAASGCAAPGGDVMFHGCAGEAQAQVLLVPDDLPLPAAEGPGRALFVTGAYTGRDTRPSGAPAPVGVAVSRGRVVGRDLARMDGILIVGPDGALGLHRRDAVPFEGGRYDLTVPDERMAFLEAAAEAGASVLQSHLLVIDGRVDTRPVEDAPSARRRVLYTKGEAFGVWESDGAVTLDAAARTLAAEIAPEMAFNLDMGGHDFCLDRENGVERACGVNRADYAESLSTLLLLERP
ncbi:MAG: hypothetical protein ACFBWO_00415 [Paracoccaceae bacterium]